MNKLLIILSMLILLLTMSFSGNAPKWVKTYGSDTGYDRDKYITGFGISEKTGNDSKKLESAKALALRDAAGMIKTKIVSTLEIEEKEINDDASSMSKMSIQTSINFDLSGIDTYEKYYDSNEKIYYALCVIDRLKLYNSIIQDKDKYIEEYKSKIDLVNKLIDKNDYVKANEEYTSSVETLDKLNQNFLLANYLSGNKTKLDDLNDLYKLKGSAYNKLKLGEINNFDDLAKKILEPYDYINLKSKTFTLIPAYYKSTTISSEFFNYLKDFLILYLEKKGATYKESIDASPDYVLKGSFYDTNKGYKILYGLTDMKTGIKAGLSETDITKQFVDNSGLKIFPDNINAALTDNKIFNQAVNDKTGIDLKVWTNKGTDDLVFKKDEEVNFYVMVNKSGYISILYHLAGKDRLRTPLIENYYIPPEMIYKPVKIEPGFIVYPPFGSETAQVFFSTIPQDKFETVTTKVDGEEYNVLSKDYVEFILKKRGLKSAIKQETAETFVTITTIEK